MPVGAHVLWPEKAKKSQPMACTSTGSWRMLCAASTTNSAPAAWARSARSATGTTAPLTLETWVAPSTFTGSRSSSSSSRATSMSPRSSKGTTWNRAPVRLQSCCQGTKFA